MKSRPILFSGPMVRALLDGRYDVSKHNAERVIKLPNEQIASLYRLGKTVAELALIYECSRPTITKALRSCNVEMRPAKQRPGVLAGSKNPAWDGGRHIRTDGYVGVTTENGLQLEHRIVASWKLGRELHSKEIVHHINGIKSDNRPENLEVMTQAQHAKHHAPEMHAARYEK